MTKPRALVLLDARAPELESCSYCPKLCRAACPVADSEASDTVTPWSIMSQSLEVARGRLPADAETAELSWACSGCRACTGRCDLNNPVAETLFDARAEFLRQGLEPLPVRAWLARHAERRQRTRARVTELSVTLPTSANASTVLVLGCSYLQRLPQETEDAVRACLALFGDVRLASGCCGLARRTAGDAAGADAEAAELRQELRSAQRVIAVDAGCAHALRDVAEPFARAAAAALRQRAPSAPLASPPLRYHDPCWLGRGLGEYQAPREILTRALGKAPLEFARSETEARCVGGGAHLPITRKDTARDLARRRQQEHEQLGGGRIVSACGNSVRSLRQTGADVVDLVTIVRQMIEK